jgi:hypothetical protein
VNDTSKVFHNSRIRFIKKVNFGIPGGDNWLVEWNAGGKGSTLKLYRIHGGKVKEAQSSIGNEDLKVGIESIVAGIPGTPISGGNCALGDFNGDGVDEIFTCDSGYIRIYGYDENTEDFKRYCFVNFDSIESGIPPVQFVRHRGMDGFKVFYPENTAGRSGASAGDEANWFFFTWEAERREYIEIGAMGEGGVPLHLSEYIEEGEYTITAAYSMIHDQSMEEIPTEKLGAILSVNKSSMVFDGAHYELRSDRHYDDDIFDYDFFKMRWSGMNYPFFDENIIGKDYDGKVAKKYILRNGKRIDIFFAGKKIIVAAPWEKEFEPLMDWTDSIIHDEFFYLAERN